MWRILFALPILAMCCATLCWRALPVSSAGDEHQPIVANAVEAQWPSHAVEGVDSPAAATDLVPADGFEVTIFAGDDLVHDAGCLTTDSDGRIAVSGPGYIRLLLDRDGDGRADAALPFADGPRTGAQGLHFDGDDLLAVGDGGLLRYRDRDRDGRADGSPVVLLPLKTGGEHHAHAVRPGPDGWWYLICGNDTGVTAATITSPDSPIVHPQAGVLLRFRYESPDDAVRDVEVVADGLRNAYDFDFTREGDAVTFDSDDEREVSLPWYRPTRVFRLTPGSHAGWINRSWKRPDAYPEVPEVLASLGRGSPTGVLVDRNGLLPPPFRGSVIVCDWTFGRVVAIPLDQESRPGTPVALLTAAGAAGFAPTDLDFAADGSLLISAGGRGTTGTVYRLRPTTPAAPDVSETPASVPTSISNRKTLERIAASLRRQAGELDSPTLQQTVLPALSDTAPNVRKAAMQVVGRLSPAATGELDALATAAGPGAMVRFHLGRLLRTTSVDLVAFETAVDVLVSDRTPPAVQYDAIRLAQLALGDVGSVTGVADTFSGYASRVDLAEWQQPIAPLAERIAVTFPTGNDDVDHELLRLLAMLEAGDDQLPERVMASITPASHPTDDLHRLFVIARLKPPASQVLTERIATALVALDAKCDQLDLHIDNNWDGRIGDLISALLTGDQELAGAIVGHREFGRPGHAVLVERLKKPHRRTAAQAFLRAAEDDADDAWTPAIVALIDEFETPDIRMRYRTLVDVPAVRDAALLALTSPPEPTDRDFYLEGLQHVPIELREASVTALEALSPSSEPAEIAAIAVAIRQLGRDDREYALRSRLVVLLQEIVENDFGFITGPAGHVPQADAVQRIIDKARELAPEHLALPAEADARLASALSASARLTGDVARGRAWYESQSCHRCHEGGAVGPDLAGVVGRFSRDDLFEAIASPDRSISERYRGTQLVTTWGKTITGLVVYESADGVTLKDGTRTWRLETDEIEHRQPIDVSLMPRGLLDEATPQNLADLEAYLRTLSK